MIALYRPKEARHAGRRRRADRRRARPGRGDRTVHGPLRPQGAPSCGVQGVRLQERDPADGDRPHRAAAADRSRQGGRPLPGQAWRGRLSRGLRVPGRSGQRRAVEEGRCPRRRAPGRRRLDPSARDPRPVRRAAQAREVQLADADLPLRAGRAASGSGGPARAGARVPAPGARRRAAGAARTLVGRLRPRVQPQDGRARLDRDDVAQALRRPRAQRARALRRARGDAGRRRAGVGALDRRPPVRAAAPALRHRGAAPEIPAGHRAWRALVRDRHERARRGFGPGVAPHARRAGRRWLSSQRHHGVHEHRASGHAAPDVAVGRRHAAGRREPEPRGGGGQGRRHHVRAGDSRDRSRAARCRAHDRLGQRPPAGARLSRAARAVVLAPRRHARDPARHHRARAGPAMNELRTILGDVVTRLFTDRVTQDLIEAAEQGQWPEPLWRAVEENGLTLPVVPESKGGAGGTWADAYIVMRAAGRHAVPLPLAETIVGAWVLSESGLDVPTGPLTLAPVHRDETLRLTRAGGGWRLSGTAARVPWGGAAGHVVVVAECERRVMVALAARGAGAVARDQNLAREPRDTLTFDGAPVVAAAPAGRRVPANTIWLYGALARSAQMAGGLDYLLRQASQYATERRQFGKPIGSFQAIQQNLAVLAGHTAAAGTAAANACRAADRGDPAFEIGAAKVRVGEAAGIGASITHQAHGAIGFTYAPALR